MDHIGDNHPAHILLILVFAFFLVALAEGATNDNAALGKWQALMGKKGVLAVFDAIDESSLAWPKVHSAEFVADLKGNVRQEQESFLSLAPRILDDAAVFAKDIPQRDPKQSAQRLDAILRVRDDMLTNPGYANLVVADALTRVGYVFLCKELGIDQKVSPDFEKSLSRLLAYRMPLTDWITLAREELKWDREKCLEIETEQNKEYGFHKLWKLLSKGDDFDFPRNLAKSGSYDLLKKRDLSLLMHRYVHTDIMLKTLSLAVQYKKQTDRFSLEDGDDKIAKVIPAPVETSISVITKSGVKKENVPMDKTALSVGERILDLQLSYPHVARLLRSIKSGDIDKQLCFQLQDLVPPENKSTP